MRVLNESVATLVDFPIWSDPVHVVNEVLGLDYWGVTQVGSEPGVHYIVQSEVLTEYPDLQQLVFTPETPPQDAGENGVWIKALTEDVVAALAPPRAVAFTMFYDV